MRKHLLSATKHGTLRQIRARISTGSSQALTSAGWYVEKVQAFSNTTTRYFRVYHLHLWRVARQSGPLSPCSKAIVSAQGWKQWGFERPQSCSMDSSYSKEFGHTAVPPRQLLYPYIEQTQYGGTSDQLSPVSSRTREDKHNLPIVHSSRRDRGEVTGKTNREHSSDLLLCYERSAFLTIDNGFDSTGYLSIRGNTLSHYYIGISLLLRNQYFGDDKSHPSAQVRINHRLPSQRLPNFEAQTGSSICPSSLRITCRSRSSTSSRTNTRETGSSRSPAFPEFPSRCGGTAGRGGYVVYPRRRHPQCSPCRPARTFG